MYKNLVTTVIQTRVAASFISFASPLLFLTGRPA